MPHYIHWDRVAEQYDQMVKYATAVRTGTASTEAILRLVHEGQHRACESCKPALVYVNTLMLQNLLAEADWDDVLTLEDQRGLIPRFWSHAAVRRGEAER